MSQESERNRKEYRHQYYIKNRDKILAQHKKYYCINAEHKKDYQNSYRKHKQLKNSNWKRIKEMSYKIGKTFEEVEQWFNKQWMKQQAQCAICGKVFSGDDCIDHDHSTNQLRGLLCASCNVGLGALKDSSDICLKASNYLKV
jgi:hypothetical protein